MIAPYKQGYIETIYTLISTHNISEEFILNACCNLIGYWCIFKFSVCLVPVNIMFYFQINHPRYNQRRVSNVKLLGELYNYRMVESTLIFNVLYSLITFGVSYDIKRPSTYDPPDHLFRIRLVCVLLETCGQYFDRGSSKKKLDCFIPYLQVSA